jgi:hypothetical protein|tara:strand:- start:6155 stop:6958 length:804 start_codon:yes stop_codon:yes gene_type:complete
MEVVDTGSLAVQRIWAPVDAVDIYRVGMLVGWEAGAYDGIVNAGAAGAGPDATTKICGIIEAVDERDPTHVSNTTAVGNQVTGVVTAAAQEARELGFSSDRGSWIYGDKSVHVKVALLTPWTKVKVPLFNAAYGTAPTLLTNTVADATGISGTVTNACDFTPVADTCSMYCRTGLSEGQQRVTDDTSTTTPTNDQAFSKGTAIGDTFVRVPGRTFGESALATDAEALYFDVAQTSDDNHWIFNVLEMNLQNAGEEHVIGFFDYQHFD